MAAESTERGGGACLPASTTARAILFSAFTALASFGTRVWSGHRDIGGPGALLLLGAAFSLAGTPALLPALIILQQRNPDGPRDQDEAARIRCRRTKAPRATAGGRRWDEVEKREHPRLRRRLSCELVVQSERHIALVRALAPHGLFVQTRARLEPGVRLTVVFAEREQQPELRVQARVARQRRAPPRLQASVPGGIGLELIDPPAAFQDLVARRTGQAAAEPQEPRGSGPTGAAAVRTFRVRVSQRGEPGSRVITVRSESLHGARARALTRAGRGWKIADIQEL
jgi:hypothetical protein